MSGEHYRYCVECEEEFRPGIVTCSDCGGPLEDRYEGMPLPEGAGDEEPADFALDPASLKVLVSADDAAEAGEVVRTLSSAGIRCLVQPSGAYGTGFNVLVPVDQLEAARGHLPSHRQPVADAFDAEKGYPDCPACGRVGVRGLPECPECGLALTAEEGE